MADEIEPAKIPYRHGKTAGQAGYRKGCRCNDCRAGHRKAQARYRENRRRRESADAKAAQALADATVPPEDEGTSAAPDWSLPPGEIEQVLQVELDELLGSPPWKQTLLAMARYNAKILDQLPVMERLDLASGIQSRLLNVLDRLRRVTDGAGGPAGSWEAALSGLDEAD